MIATAVWAQQGASAPPQTARQALLEMFFSKTPGTLVKHLPDATRATLEKTGALASLQQYSSMASQFEVQGKTFQTYPTGSILLAADDPKTGQKFEVTVENDSLRGDEDDIELTFQGYKDGQVQRASFMPRMTFAMKTESGIWKLNEIVVTVRLPLADPDLLKSLAENMKPQAAAAQSPVAPQAERSFTLGSDASVIAALRTILAAETTYAGTYKAVGYTCTLSDLDGFGSGEVNEHQAMLINSGLAGGRKYGYVFSISGCSGMPSSTFHLTAVPGGNSYGRRAFCADQSGMIRASDDGNAATCLASGTPVQ